MPRLGLTTTSVVRQGAELADEIGFAQVSVTTLARRLGIKTASLYAHVRGNDDLRLRIAMRALEEMADRADRDLAGRAGLEALVALGEVYRGYAAEHPGRYDASRFPMDAQSAAASAGPRHAALSRAVLRGYDLDEAHQVHAVRLLGSTFHGFVSLELAGGFAHSRPPSQESWTAILASLDLILTNWSDA